MKIAERRRPVTRWLFISSTVSACLSAAAASLLFPPESRTFWQDVMSLQGILILCPAPLLAQRKKDAQQRQ